MSNFSNSFYQRTKSARKIIVVDLGFLGDSLHLIPALAEIKRHYPKAELHTLSAPVGREVMALTPSVDRAWTFPLGPQSPSWWKHWDVIRNLRREKFDVAFNFSGADRTIFLTALTGARWRIGHPGGRRHFWNSWLIPEWVSRQSQAVPVFEQRRRILAECGLTLTEPRFELKVPAEAHQWALPRIPSGAIHLSINASKHRKEWPLEQWITLLRQRGDHAALAGTVGRLATHLAVLRQISVAITARLARGESPVVEAALIKDLGTEFEQSIPAIVEACIGAGDKTAQDPQLLRTLAYVSQMAPSYSLRGGTREILRSMIARGLGLR